MRSEGRHWIAHGRDPNFGPWLDTAQLDYRHPEVPRAMTQTLREVATRCDGVVCSMAMLVLDDVFRSTWGSRSVAPVAAEDASPFGEFWWHASSAVRDVYPRFMLIGEAYWGLEWRLQQLGFDYTYDSTLLDRMLTGDPAAVAGHLRADDGYQRRSVRLLEDRNSPRDRSPDDARRRSAPRPSSRRSSRACSSSATARSRAPASRPPSSSGASRPSCPIRTLHEYYCRLLRATDDEAFRLGQAVRLEPISAWPGNTTHEGILARLWVGQHRQLRLAVANMSAEPAQAYIPLALPEFAGKTVRLEDQLDDVRVRPAGRRRPHAGASSSTCPRTADTCSGSPARRRPDSAAGRRRPLTASRRPSGRSRADPPQPSGASSSRA